MSVDDKPEWWLRRLSLKLDEQARLVNSNDDWHEGNHPLPAASASERRLFIQFQKMSRSNYAGKVVDAVADRLAVVGVDLHDETLSKLAWSLWQESSLDADQGMLMSAALGGGIAYLSVWTDEDNQPRFAPEHGAQVTHEWVPGSLRKVAAALKVFPDDQLGDYVAELYLPDHVCRWRAKQPESFQFPGQLGGMAEEPNEFGVVPMVPLPNQLTLKGTWSSELRNAIRPQRRINQTLLNLMVAQEAVAFPQRWGTGLEVVKDPVTGEPIRPFRSGADGLWVDENPEAKFGQFAESRFDGYMQILKSQIEEIASTTSTPLFNLSAQLAVPPSAEALSAMESGLVKKAEQRQRTFGEAFERAMRIALKMKGQPLSANQDMEVLWADARVRSDAALGDYLTKLASIGVPLEALWAEAGASPPKIAQWRRMAMSDAFMKLVAQVGEQQQAGAPANEPVTAGAVA